MLNKNKVIGNVVFIIIILIIFAIFLHFFEKYNFNDYQKSEYFSNKSDFSRDGNEKYSKNKSYRIKSDEFNDAMFYKSIKVEKNTVYKITCMVKTQNIKTQKESSNAGAQISVADTTEMSKALRGNNDWQKLELLIDSKDRDTIDIGFRLGGYEDNCSGTAWFTDFSIESGVKETSSEWKFALFIFENLDVNINQDGENKNIKSSMNEEDINTMVQDMEIFKNSIRSLSGNKMTVTTNLYKVAQPITTLSYDEENGYFVSTKDVENIIDDEVRKNEFDHIFIAVRFGDILSSKNASGNDWIGLGYMDYYGIGFSNIRLPNNSSSYLYKYNSNTNTFPEEVFVHEFLHSLERNLNERNYNIPELHSYKTYGYKNDSTEGLKKWYKDYMQKSIKTANGNIGLDSDAYTIKPVKESCFEYSQQLNYFDEPKTLFGEIGKLFSTLF